MSFSPNLFLSNIRGKDGLAKPCRFQVILPIPNVVNNSIGNSIIEKILNFPNSIFTDVTDAITSAVGGAKDAQNSDAKSTTTGSLSRYLSLQCESAELPGRTLQTADVKSYGPIFKVPYQSVYGDTNLTFLCTNDFYERKLFDRWMEAIHPSDTNNVRYAKGENSRYLTNIKIIQYDDFIKQIYAVELIDAFPIGIAPQALNWGEEGFHRLGVQFAYQKYKTLYNGNYNLGEAATALFGSAASRLLPIGTALTL
jgi:hypothetical protein